MLIVIDMLVAGVLKTGMMVLGTWYLILDT